MVIKITSKVLIIMKLVSPLLATGAAAGAAGAAAAGAASGTGVTAGAATAVVVAASVLAGASAKLGVAMPNAHRQAIPASNFVIFLCINIPLRALRCRFHRYGCG